MPIITPVPTVATAPATRASDVDAPAAADEQRLSWIVPVGLGFAIGGFVVLLIASRGSPPPPER